MDIERLSVIRVNTNNDRATWIAFNTAQGPRHSANEHLIPENLFNDPNAITKNVHGISAVKALQIAASQGQKIYRIDQSNISSVLPQLQHKALIIQDIQNAVAAGKVVTISQKAITQNGWTGVGYSIVDPSTGAGAYLIGGGADGAAIVFTIIAFILLFAALVLFFSPFAFAAVLGATAIADVALLVIPTIFASLTFFAKSFELARPVGSDAANSACSYYQFFYTTLLGTVVGGPFGSLINGIGTYIGTAVGTIVGKVAVPPDCSK